MKMQILTYVETNVYLLYILEPSNHIFLQVIEVSLQRCCARSAEDSLYLF